MILFSENGKERLKKNFFEYNICFFDSIDSTQLECEKKYDLNPSGKWLILANQQTSGRGRYSRSWQSEKNVNIYMSFTINNYFSNIGYLNLFFGSILYETISSLYGNFGGDLTVKWPNDLYIGDKKLAGILFQSLDSKIKNVIVGIGINVYASESQIPVTGTSLYMAGVKADRLDIIEKLLDNVKLKSINNDENGSIILSDFWNYAARTRLYPYCYTCFSYKYEGILKEICTMPR